MMIPVSLRRWHSYIGLFIAPSVLLFALTGAVQIFDLHNEHDGYHPAPWVKKLSELHTDQAFKQPHEHDAPAQAAGAQPAPAPAPPPAPADDDTPTTATLALKWFFFLIAIALAGSTSVGIWMGLTQIRPKGRAWALLLAGALLPICLLAI
jgi:hypothetical protein